MLGAAWCWSLTESTTDMTTTKKPRRMARTPQTLAGVSEPQAKQTTKQDLVLALLRREGGAPLSAIIEVTGWLPHTARAALTGLRKKGHEVARSKIDGETRYSVAGASVQ